MKRSFKIVISILTALSIILMNESFIIVHGLNSQTITGVSVDRKYLYTVEKLIKIIILNYIFH